MLSMSTLNVPSGLILLAIAALVVVAVSLWRRRNSARQEDDSGSPTSPGTRPSPPAANDQYGQVYELIRLDNRAADHTTPDAIVRVPYGFDPFRPVHLVVYNHGFYTDIRGAYRDAELAKQLAALGANTILFLPEWQKRPGAASSDQGRFSQPGLFRNMVNEAFSKVPTLRSINLNNVSRVTILAHSAGYGPAETEIYVNGLGAKIVNVTLLDALYDRYGFDRFIEDNIADLGTGKKRFYNFFYGTANYSKAQAATVKRLLGKAGLSLSLCVEDYDKGNDVREPDAVTAHGIIFKYSSVRYNGLDPHFAVPNLYVRAAVLASEQ